MKRRPLSPDERVARYLDLFAAQVAATVRDSEQPVGTLAQAVLSMASSASAIVEALRKSKGVSKPVRAALESHCSALIERVQRAVVAFQYHDRMTQNLGHVAEGLVEVAAALRVPRRRGAESWQVLGERVRARCSLHEQLALFDQHVNGVTGTDATAPEAGGNGPRRAEIF